MVIQTSDNRGICTSPFIDALFMRAKTWNQHRYSTIDGQLCKSLLNSACNKDCVANSVGRHWG